MSLSHYRNRDLLIALDEKRQINNGQPSLWAFLLGQIDVAAGEQALHLGCGTGYYLRSLPNSSRRHGDRDRCGPSGEGACRAEALATDHGQQRGRATLSFEPADLMVAS